MNTEENIGFWIDEAAKIITLADSTPLTARRFDDRWISAARGDVSYEFDRQNDISDIREFDYERWHCDDHNRVGPVQSRSSLESEGATRLEGECRWLEASTAKFC